MQTPRRHTDTHTHTHTRVPCNAPGVSLPCTFTIVSLRRRRHDALALVEEQTSTEGCKSAERRTPRAIPPDASRKVAENRRLVDCTVEVSRRFSRHWETRVALWYPSTCPPPHPLISRHLQTTRIFRSLLLCVSLPLPLVLEHTERNTRCSHLEARSRDPPPSCSPRSSNCALSVCVCVCVCVSTNEPGLTSSTTLRRTREIQRFTKSLLRETLAPCLSATSTRGKENGLVQPKGESKGLDTSRSETRQGEAD